jgi:hypothetical protein
MVKPRYLSRYSDRLRAALSGFGSRQAARFLLVCIASRPAVGPTQPPIRWVPGAISPGGKVSSHEADHSPLSNAEVKKLWSYTYASPYVFTE